VCGADINKCRSGSDNILASCRQRAGEVRLRTVHAIHVTSQLSRTVLSGGRLIVNCASHWPVLVSRPYLLPLHTHLEHSALLNVMSRVKIRISLRIPFKNGSN
jgi:hypothetical protein